MRSASAIVTISGEVRSASKIGGRGLELSEHKFGRGDLEFTRRFDVDMGCHAVLGDDGKALSAHSHAVGRAVQFQPEGPGIFAVTIRQHEYLVAHVAGLSP